MARRPLVTNMPTQTPSAVQLDVSPTTLVMRGLRKRCPACGADKTHVSPYKMADRCHQCSLRFERIAGHSLGYIGLNTTVTFTLTFFVLLAGAIIMHPDIRVVPLLAASLAMATIFPALFLPIAHTLWTAFDLIMRPLTPGEVDPRFIKVDPVLGAI